MKWLLAIPHWIVLRFLWIAFVVLTLVALVAILFTGRYPRALFDFNVGVLRWTWRVVLLRVRRSAPTATRRSRSAAEPTTRPSSTSPTPSGCRAGKAFLKPWLLAVPHYADRRASSAAACGWARRRGRPPGLIAVLVLVAGVVLLFAAATRATSSTSSSASTAGSLRVAAYAALMRDEYPPFRLDR